MSRQSARERGAAAVEMALVLPVLILLVGGIIDLGRAFMTEILVTNAAREGTRVATVVRDPADLGQVTTRAATAAGLAPPVVPTVTITPSTGCTATGYTGNVTVKVSAPFEWVFLGALPGSLPTSLSGTSVMGC